MNKQRVYVGLITRVKKYVFQMTESGLIFH
jgi:hypothetical protein